MPAARNWARNHQCGFSSSQSSSKPVMKMTVAPSNNPVRRSGSSGSKRGTASNCARITLSVKLRKSTPPPRRDSWRWSPSCRRRADIFVTMPRRFPSQIIAGLATMASASARKKVMTKAAATVKGVHQSAGEVLTPCRSRRSHRRRCLSSSCESARHEAGLPAHKYARQSSRAVPARGLPANARA